MPPGAERTISEETLDLVRATAAQLGATHHEPVTRSTPWYLRLAALMAAAGDVGRQCYRYSEGDADGGALRRSLMRIAAVAVVWLEVLGRPPARGRVAIAVVIPPADEMAGRRE